MHPIDLPWDHIVNPWELLTIAHEVGHDLDEDLGQLTVHLRQALHARLKKEEIPDDRIAKWEFWVSEILADMFGVLLTGPAFVSVLIELITLPRKWVLRIDPTDPHPPHYLRVFVNTALLRRLGLVIHADLLETNWKALYGHPDPNFALYFPEIELVVATILETALPVLVDTEGTFHSLIALVNFTPLDQESIEEFASRVMSDGASKQIPIRHLVSVSQVAFEHLVRQGQETKLEALAHRTARVILDLAPPGQLPVHTSRRFEQHLNQLARIALDRPIEDFGLPEAIG